MTIGCVQKFTDDVLGMDLSSEERSKKVTEFYKELMTSYPHTREKNVYHYINRKLEEAV